MLQGGLQPSLFSSYGGHRPPASESPDLIMHCLIVGATYVLREEYLFNFFAEQFGD